MSDVLYLTVQSVMLRYFFISKKHIFLAYGGPDGELGASLRYLSQRYSVPYPEIKAVLTDIGTEEYEPIRYKVKLYIFDLIY